ncbi:YkvA family protein [Lysinibacillus sp. NPDC096418]|uniref:YkvA family protein n=1 Tax=Lysinibacillus sp. NPDC096418 TaxID=3364138 RepID=UPI00382C739C
MNEIENIPNEQEQLDFYNKLRAKLIQFLSSKKGKSNKFTKYLLFAPDLFHLMIKTMMDSDVDKKSKALIGGGIAYFMMPFDFLPEGLIGFGGYMDDIVIATMIINTLINKLGPGVIEKHWSGDEQLLNVLQKVSETSDQVVSKIPVKSAIANVIIRESKAK